MNKISFTMAEILLSLTIIGVVAAITLPSLTGNINERTWNTQRKALYARMSQAIALMGNLNGFGIGATESQTASYAANAFVTQGLAKVLKINNICDYQHLQDCGFQSRITTFTGDKINVPNTILELHPNFNVSLTNSDLGESFNYSMINTKSVAFETQNGESIIAFYNPFCRENYLDVNKLHPTLTHLQGQMCVNFVYDLNGKKGPNTVGKDIGFMTAINPTDSSLYEVMFAGVASETMRDSSKLIETCHNFDANSRVPNEYEGSVIAYNRLLIGINSSAFWVSSTYNISPAFLTIDRWRYNNSNPYVHSYNLNLYCIKNIR